METSRNVLGRSSRQASKQKGGLRVEAGKWTSIEARRGKERRRKETIQASRRSKGCRH